MFSVVIHCAAVPDPSVTALCCDVWERISPLCILNDRIMKFVCFYRAGVYEECVLLGVCVMLTHFCKRCIFSAQVFCGLVWRTVSPQDKNMIHTHIPQLKAM